MKDRAKAEYYYSEANLYGQSVPYWIRRGDAKQAGLRAKRAWHAAKQAIAYGWPQEAKSPGSGGRRGTSA